MADSLVELGFEKALVVNSMGIDELTPAGPADVFEISEGGAIKEYKVYPKDVGIPSCDIEGEAKSGSQSEA